MIKIVDQDALETAMASVKGYVDERYVQLDNIYKVGRVIDFGGDTSLTTYLFLDHSQTLNRMMIAAKHHTEGDAPVEGIFTFVNFIDINGTFVSTPVSVKTTSVWYSELGQFNCTFLLCGMRGKIASESDGLAEIIPDTSFSITLE